VEEPAPAWNDVNGGEVATVINTEMLEATTSLQRQA
jgi:hypothetical protein